ncbi:LOW QUALITY PROTEIN: vomeronasal type-1 receptor 4-like [Papio anubis]|uniref:LOW QUALITY PROTEIN: vomeronasal type-1 receptor 4-like n=1 Tax=Papio anubis TaxID=9555 RepID=UPI000B7B5C54|nr:LOW QUALITY PROTEIN: vomeronasal type-1 receptor 4-like [Papio anubis]
MSHFAQRNDCCYNLKESVLNDRTSSRDMTIGMMFLSQTTVGILGNFSLLYHYLFLYVPVSRLRCTDLIFKHLAIANCLILLSNGVPQTIVAFGLKYFINDFECNLLLYVQILGRGVSIGNTCLLSVFQTIMISPVNSCLKDLKVKAPKYIGFSISLCWILHMVVNFIFLICFLYLSSKWIPQKDHEKITGFVYTALIVLLEVLSSVLIIWASGSMIFILYRHNQYIHRTHASPGSSPESRATKSILVLASTFVSSYTLSSMFHTSIALFHNLSWWLANISKLISLCFPTVSPFLLMSCDSNVSRLFFVWTRNKKFHHVIRKT